jgi:hypothetical protein
MHCDKARMNIAKTRGRAKIEQAKEKIAQKRKAREQ